MDFPSRSSVRTVACPNCGAEAGRKCWSVYRWPKNPTKRTKYQRESNHMERVQAFLLSQGHTKEEVGIA